MIGWMDGCQRAWLFHSSIHPFIHSSIHPFIHTSIHPFIHTSIHPLLFARDASRDNEAVVRLRHPRYTACRRRPSETPR
ncbi:MAG: hypothetical protein FJ291_10855 [Planctomycetes bacterium]|nr:hypothetical protein [Planctomycetota bacterium]